MPNKLFTYLVLPLLLLLCNSSENSVAQPREKNPDVPTGTLEKMIVANGTVAMTLDLDRLGGAESATNKSKSDTLRFTVAPNSFFTLLVLNNDLRGPEPSSMALTPQDPASLPRSLNSSFNQLVIEKTVANEAFDLVVRDSRSGSVLFNIDGHQYDYDASKHLLNISNGRLLVSEQFAKQLQRPSRAGAVVGHISIVATVYPIEIDHLVNGTVESAVMPPLRTGAGTASVQPSVGTTPGPDVIVGELPSVSQAGSNGNYVGLGVGTTSCNAGTVDLDWFQLPNNDHPVIPQNLYRLSGGTTNTDRFEQIGQSWLKHAFTALTNNDCSYGCNGVGGAHLGSGCSDPYSAGLNSGQNGIGSRAWVNPFTGFYPGSAPSSNDHSGHSHTGTSHRVTVAMTDLNTTLNPGATYFAEGHYVTPHEYAWCSSHPGQCNMYNNVSYRQFTVSGTTSFSFSPAASTVRQRPAIYAWTGAILKTFEPAPGMDGIGIVACKVTNPSAGVWHYEYAVYNENLDRAIRSLSVPLGCGVTVSNLGFHAPPQEPAWPNDGTQNNAGYSSAGWIPTQTSSALTWSCEGIEQNQNANAIRWGTMYNFRFDCNKPPQSGNATLGFFKTGSPTGVGIQIPTADPCNPLQITSVVSRKTHGAVGDFDIDLPLSGSTGAECRSGGVDGNHTIVFTFTNNVVSGNATLTTGTGSILGSPAFTGNTMTVNLTGVTDEQQISLTATNVTDSFGQTLPDTAVSAVILMGDANGNRAVNASDVAMVKAQLGTAVDATNFRTDVNANGGINASDVGLVKSNTGRSVP